MQNWLNLISRIKEGKRNPYYLPVTLIAAIHYLEAQGRASFRSDMPIPYNDLVQLFQNQMASYPKQSSKDPGYPVRTLFHWDVWNMIPEIAYDRDLQHNDFVGHNMIFATRYQLELANAEIRGQIIDNLNGLLP